MNKSSFRFLWIGQSLANSGDVFYMVGLIAIIYELTGSVTYMAFVPFFITASRFVSGIIAPLIIERVSLKALLAYSQLGKTIAIIILIGYIDVFSSINTTVLIFFLCNCHLLFRRMGKSSEKCIYSNISRTKCSGES